MSKLGNVEVFIGKGKIIGGIVVLDPDRRQAGGVPMIPVRPTDGDIIEIVFREKPE